MTTTFQFTLQQHAPILRVASTTFSVRVFRMRGDTRGARARLLEHVQYEFATHVIAMITDAMLSGYGLRALS